MIEHLRLLQHKGLQGCELNDLGKINVVCGKNNSGKTTVLEAILIPEKNVEGKRFSAEELEKLVEALKAATATQASGSHYVRLVSNIMRGVAGGRDVWYADQADAFVNLIDQQRRGPLGSLAWQPHIIANNYKALFLPREKMTVALIPPKRQLQPTTGINTGETPTFEGLGTLNYLNYAKNQRAGSSDRLIFERIKKAFEDVSNGYSFEIEPDRSNILNLSFSFKDGDLIPAKDCGLGLQDLLVLLYFAIHPRAGLVLIEEPESHLHPELQRRLLFFLREDTDKEKQFVITTHANVFLDGTLVDRVFFTTYNNSVEVDDATSRASILGDLGYSVADNLVSDVVILVEGPTDVGVVEEFLAKRGLTKAYAIKTWSLGGDNMAQQDLTVFAEHYAIIALIDQDPNSAAVRKRFEHNCNDLGIPVYRLQRRALENYFSLEALKKVFNKQMPPLERIDYEKPLEEQLGFSVKRQNRRIAHEMSLSDIEGTDFAEFLDKVEELCEKGAGPD